MEYVIAPSIFSADIARLGAEVDAALAAGGDFVHFDVMDNHYVPNLTLGPMVCKALRKYGVTAPIDVHLMVEPVDDLIVRFAAAGATYITFHPEASRHIDQSIKLIRNHGCKPGLVLNPATGLEQIKYVIDQLDMVLLMSVNHGFGGQQFLPYVLDKIKETRNYIESHQLQVRLEVDGGVAINNIAAIAEAGADTFVAGSAIFDSGNYKETIDAMRKQLSSVIIR